MDALSLGDIAKLAGYSRARIHQFAVEGRIPGEPLRRPPEGQFRFADTPELRAWCKAKRKTKPKAMPGRPGRKYSRRVSSRDERAIYDMVTLLECGQPQASDIRNAIALLDACRPLSFASLDDNPQPCTKGTLSTLAHFLVGWRQFEVTFFQKSHQCLDSLRKDLDRALQATPKSQQPSPTARA